MTVIISGDTGIDTIQNGIVTNPKLSSTALISTSTAQAVGYGTGAGGAVTQITSRTTTVTVNALSGAITMFTAAGSTTWASFLVNNSLVTANDTVVVTVRFAGATNTYLTSTLDITAGAFRIAFASAGGVASDTPVINFAIIKGANS